MSANLCRNCGRAKVNRPRGLCWNCYYTPGVKDRFPQTSKYARPRTGATPMMSDELRERITVEGQQVFAITRRTPAELQTERIALAEALANIENDDGRIPAPIWKLRNDALSAFRRIG